MNFAKQEYVFYRTHPVGVFLNKFLFELSSVISKVLIAEHVFVCFVSIVVLRIIEKPYRGNEFLLKVNNRETLKQDVKSVKS